MCILPISPDSVCVRALPHNMGDDRGPERAMGDIRGPEQGIWGNHLQARY